uniref:7TM_GPCR_Srx domain-containing protein n=1 Tax=Meloidogyne hapla TaxID=6305 RepID=A0A1I8BP81_MELHA
MDVNTFSHPMMYLTLTSIYNSQILIDIHSFFLILVICISIADYYLIYRNKKIKSNFFSSISSYSLSQSYQAKQNILLMKIIFPLDFSYTFVYALFNILSTFIRSKRQEYGQLVYVRTYDGTILVNKFLS